MRKELKEMAENLVYWLNDEPRETADLFLNIIAAMPGGEVLRDLGYDKFRLFWAEVELLEDMLKTIETQKDVEELAKYIIDSKDE